MSDREPETGLTQQELLDLFDRTAGQPFIRDAIRRTLQPALAYAAARVSGDPLCDATLWTETWGVMWCGLFAGHPLGGNDDGHKWFSPKQHTRPAARVSGDREDGLDVERLIEAVHRLHLIAPWRWWDTGGQNTQVDGTSVQFAEAIAREYAASPAPEPRDGLDAELLRDAMYDANQRCSGIPGECCAPPTHADAKAIAAEYARLAATTSSADAEPA